MSGMTSLISKSGPILRVAQGWLKRVNPSYLSPKIVNSLTFMRSELSFVSGKTPEHVVDLGPAAECGGGSSGEDQVWTSRRPGPNLHQHLRPPRLGHQGVDGSR